MKTHLIKLSACKIASLIAICVCFWLHTIFAQETNIQKASGSQGQTNSNLFQASKNGFSAMMFFTEDLDFPKNFAQGGDITLNATSVSPLRCLKRKSSIDSPINSSSEAKKV